MLVDRGCKNTRSNGFIDCNTGLLFLVIPCISALGPNNTVAVLKLRVHLHQNRRLCIFGHMVTNNPNLTLGVSDSITKKAATDHNIRDNAIVLEVSKLSSPGIGHLNPYCLTPWTRKVPNDMSCSWLQRDIYTVALNRERSIISGGLEVCYSV